MCTTTLSIDGYLDCFHVLAIVNSAAIVRMHLIGSFLCAALNLSGNLWPLLIPEYSGIKTRDMPFLGLRNPGISFVSFSL